MTDLDDLPSPKVLSLGCEYCPYDYLCGDMCILGYDELDDDGGVLAYSPSSVAS